MLALVAMSGCLSPHPGASLGSSRGETATAQRPAVVAVIDSGINPYHEVFKAHDNVDFQSFTAAAVSKQLSTQGSYDERVSEDRGFWNQVRPGQLYAFNGTHVMAVSFADDPSSLILDAPNHGTGTASMIAKYDPRAVIVVVQVTGQFCTPPTTCFLSPTVARAMAWAAAQPWIDVISVSLGLPADVYDPGTIHPEAKAFQDASKLAAQTGKLVVVGSGNTIAPSVTSYLAAPPWVICVGGADTRTHGEAAHQNKMVDVVANYTEMVAQGNSTSDVAMSAGTSYSTPIVAATLAASIEAVRSDVQQDHAAAPGALVDGTLPNGQHLMATASDFRSAMNATAERWNATDWDPANGPWPDLESNIVVSASEPVVAGPAQIGWGHVDASLASAISSRVVAHSVGAEHDPTAAYMQAYQQLRENVWQ